MFYLHICLCTAYILGPFGGQKRGWVHWSESDKWLRGTAWALGTEPWSSERALHTPNS